jgi:heat shock protein HtpX
LFAGVNALILLTLSLVVGLVVGFTGGGVYIDPTWILVYAFFGFGGAFIGLAMSRQTAKWMLGVKVIDPNSQHLPERQMLDLVYRLAREAGLKTMPEVGIYESEEVNAFATGPTKARSLVAVSTGLLNRMDASAVEGVLGHEITHIANGDMVTMTLLQGLINTMVLIAARILASVIASRLDERSRGGTRYLIFMVLQFVLSLFGSMVVCYFSRRREFRADAGSARIAGRERMLSGLKSLRNVYGDVDDNQQALATLKISGHSTRTLAALFATHPPLEERIRRLESLPA